MASSLPTARSSMRSSSSGRPGSRRRAFFTTSTGSKPTRSISSSCGKPCKPPAMTIFLPLGIAPPVHGRNEKPSYRRVRRPRTSKEMVRARIRKSPEMSNRQISRLLGVSHTMVADERDRTLNPPEVKRFAEFKRTWEGLSDEHREAFVREFNTDLCDLQRSLVEHSSAGK